MKKILLSACLLIPLALSAQNIKGKITDEKNMPIPYVAVKILTVDSTFVIGTASDSVGVFNVDIPRNDTYIIAFSSLGYVPRYVRYDSTVLNTPLEIEMKEDVTTLSEVVVVSNNIKRINGMIELYPEQKVKKQSSTGYDLLYNLMLPTLSVDKRNGKVTTIGGEVSIYINGRKADRREIQSLQPSEIKKVEYFDTPTGKYIGNAAAINFVIKSSGGYLSIDGKETVGFRDGQYNLSTKIVDKNIVYSLLGGFANQKYDGDFVASNEKFIFSENSIVSRVNTTDKAQKKFNEQYVQLMVQNENDRKSLYGKISFIHHNIPDNLSNSTLHYYNAGRESLKTSHNAINESGIMPSIEVYGGFQLPKGQQISAQIVGTYIKNKYNKKFTEDIFKINNQVEENFYNTNISLNYNKYWQMSSLTVQLHHFNKISDATYAGTTSFNEHLMTGETMAFLGYNKSFSPKFQIMFQPGVSLLQYKLKSTDIKNELSMRLAFMLMYMPWQNQQLRLVSNIGNSTPKISYINKMEQQEDNMIIISGNPNLKNTTLFNNAFAYSYFSNVFQLNSMLIHNYFKNSIAPVYDIINGNQIKQTYGSDNNFQQLIGVIAITLKIRNNLHLKGEIAGIYSNSTGSINNSYFDINGKLDINYFLNKWMFNLYFKSPDNKYENALIRTTYKNGFDYGVNIRFNYNNFTIELGANTPFTKKKIIIKELDRSVYNKKTELYNRFNQQYAYVKLFYRFDFGKKVSSNNSEINKNWDSGILK